MEAAQRKAKASRVPATAGAAPSRGRADPPRPAELGRERAAPGRHQPAMLRAPALRGPGERVRAAGIGAGGRPSGEPALARAGGTLSLSGVPGALRRPLALPGAESRLGTGLPALDLARLEDEAPRRLDRVERGAATTQLAVDRQPRAVPDSTLGAREGTGQQDSGALRAPAARKLGTILRVPVRCCWKRWWTRSAFEELATALPTGSIWGRPPVGVAWTGNTKPTLKPSKTSTCTRWSAMPGNAYAAIPRGKQILLDVVVPIHLPEGGIHRIDDWQSSNSGLTSS